MSTGSDKLLSKLIRQFRELKPLRDHLVDLLVFYENLPTFPVHDRDADEDDIWCALHLLQRFLKDTVVWYYDVDMGTYHPNMDISVVADELLDGLFGALNRAKRFEVKTAPVIKSPEPILPLVRTPPAKPQKPEKKTTQYMPALTEEPQEKKKRKQSTVAPTPPPKRHKPEEKKKDVDHYQKLVRLIPEKADQQVVMLDSILGAAVQGLITADQKIELLKLHSQRYGHAGAEKQSHYLQLERSLSLPVVDYMEALNAILGAAVSGSITEDEKLKLLQMHGKRHRGDAKKLYGDKKAPPKKPEKKAPSKKLDKKAPPKKLEKAPAAVPAAPKTKHEELTEACQTFASRRRVTTRMLDEFQKHTRGVLAEFAAKAFITPAQAADTEKRIAALVANS